MNKSQLLFLVCLVLLSCQPAQTQRLEVVKFEALQDLISRDSERIEVINFWATWCKPCIKELPYFQELHDERKEVNVTLVSLDFVEHFEEKVIPFVKKRSLTPDILLLDEIDYNSWIDKVDPGWSGAIPATLVINHQTGKRKFVESELRKDEIEAIVRDIVDQN